MCWQAGLPHLTFDLCVLPHAFSYKWGASRHRCSFLQSYLYFLAYTTLPDLKQHFLFSGQNFGFLIYGRWGPPDRFKILSRGAPTFSTPGKAIPRLFEKSIFLVPRRPQWARAQWARAHGPGPMAQWARAHGPGPMGQWARAHGPGPGPDPGPMGKGPWAQWAWALGPGRTLARPWAQGPGRTQAQHFDFFMLALNQVGYREGHSSVFPEYEPLADCGEPIHAPKLLNVSAYAFPEKANSPIHLSDTPHSHLYRLRIRILSN